MKLTPYELIEKLAHFEIAWRCSWPWWVIAGFCVLTRELPCVDAKQSKTRAKGSN